MLRIEKRIPKVDWGQEFNRHWNGNNPPATHAFNALSFIFPQGEQFFIDAAKEVAQNTDFSQNQALEEEVKLFIAQEATHGNQHVKYNTCLEDSGYENVVYNVVEYFIKSAHRYLSPLTKLAFVCAYEHYTAILGDFVLSKPQVLKEAEPRMALVWGWHAAEETEHKSVSFDLYEAAGGGWIRRILAFLLVTIQLAYLFCRLFWSMLYRDGSLKFSRLPKTISQFMSFFFGKDGVNWYLLKYSFHYFSPQFHPWNRDNRLLLQTWLDQNNFQLQII